MIKRMIVGMVGVVVSAAFNVVSAQENEKPVWSYAVLSDVLEDMVDCYSKVQPGPITEIAEEVVIRDARLSPDEMLDLCNSVVDGKNFSAQLTKIDSEGCANINLLAPNPSGNIQTSTCEWFLYNLNEKHKQVANVGAMNKPGTYVKKYQGNIYKIVNVVLPDGYLRTDGVINRNVDLDARNTNIYDVDTGNIIGQTYTADMFLNIFKNDKVRGIYADSYICMDVDVTNDIYSFFNNNRGGNFYTVGQGWDLLPDGDHDTKESLADRCKIQGQDDNAAHANGVLFNGKVAHLEWLGHFLYGMVRQEIELVEPETADGIRKFVQSGLEGKNDPKNFIVASDLGAEYHMSDVVANVDRRFENVQTDTPAAAHRVVRNILIVEWGVLGNQITCSNSCNQTGNDVVWCVSTDGRRRDFIFDDVANGWLDLCDEITTTE